MSERVEYVVRDVSDGDWGVIQERSEAMRYAKAMNERQSHAVYGPFTVWKRTITESPLPTPTDEEAR